MNSLRDEWAHITKGKFIYICLIAPLLVAAIFGYTFSNNQITEAPLAIVDQDQSVYSKQLIEKIDASQYIHVTHVFQQTLSPDDLLMNEKHTAALYLPKGLELSRMQGKQSNLGLYVDSAFSQMAASSLRNGVMEVITAENQIYGSGRLKAMGLNDAQATSTLSSMSLQQRLLYNPTNQNINTMVIGFVNIVIMVILAMNVLPIVPRLREMGQLEKELEHPIGLLSRLLPYSLISCVSIYLSTGILKQFGGLRFAGNSVEILFPYFLYTFALCLLSLTIGWTAAEASKAGGRFVFIMLPSFLVSGIQAPIAILPIPLQWLSKLLPLSWHFIFVRGIGLRGGKLSQFSSELGAFLLMIGIFICFAIALIIRERRLTKNSEHMELDDLVKV